MKCLHLYHKNTNNVILIIANTQSDHAAYEYTTVMRVSDIHFKPTNSLFYHNTPRKENQKTYYRNELMLKPSSQNEKNLQSRL